MVRKRAKRSKSSETQSSELLGRLKELERKMGHQYRDVSLLRNALVHRSFLNESEAEGFEDNERLEFIGDAVLEFVVSEYLYRRHPKETEGALTVMRSSIVGRKHCAAMARRLGLEDFVLVGKGEKNAAGGMKSSILANAFEALIASLYLDGGMKAARRFIVTVVEECMPVAMRGDENFKARLQAITQKTEGVLPRYRLVSSEGPEHQKTFEVEVSAGSVAYGKGKGATKKEAEQKAAKRALEKITPGAKE